MNGINTNKHLKEIEFKLIELKNVHYYENNPSESGYDLKDIRNANFEVGMQLSFNEKNSIIILGLVVSFYKILKEKRINLFGIKTINKFKFKQFKKILVNDSKKSIKIPDQLMHTLLGISLSNTRGMLAAMNSFPEYSKIIIPLINTREMLKTLKPRNLKKNTDKK
ncbi:MAG: hypothetical protein P9M11_04755 [Candidatus Tenebribacter burtonii]|jgi:hypothetical protein|nr:hypothetical protein [Candidatus Tenebribacter burtonii]